MMNSKGAPWRLISVRRQDGNHLPALATVSTNYHRIYVDTDTNASKNLQH